MNYTIRQIKLSEYPEVRLLDRNSFGKNERGSNADEHEIFADNIRKMGYSACMTCGNPKVRNY